MKILLTTALLLALTACSTSTIMSNPAGITLGNLHAFNYDEVFEIAERHCKQYGKYARLIATDPDVSMTFSCEKA